MEIAERENHKRFEMYEADFSGRRIQAPEYTKRLQGNCSHIAPGIFFFLCIFPI
jgi:hypothetical protein